MSFTTRIFRIFFPFVIGYFITSYFRTMTAVVSPFIERDLGISPTMMSFITAVYFLSFALMQIPAGLLSDHYGPRKAQGSLFILAGIGSILFGISTGPILLIIARILIGIGMAGGLMIAFSANRLWFNVKELPMINGLSFAIGGLGAIASAYPTQLLLETFSWQSISIVAGIITLCAATVIILVMPDLKEGKEKKRIKKALAGLKVIFYNRYYWKVTPLVSASLAVLISMQSYWIAPWLKKMDHADARTISVFLLVIAILLILSVPIASLLATLFSRVKARMEWIIGLGALFSIGAQVLIALKIWHLSYVLWGAFAFFSFFPMLGYTSIALHFPSEYSGRSSSAVNLIVFTLAFALQYLFGLIATRSFIAAFWSYIIIQTCALIWFCFGKTGEYG